MCTLLVFDSSHTIAPSGSVAATAAASVGAGQRAGRARPARRRRSDAASAPTSSASAAQRALGVVTTGRQHVHLAALGDEVARLAGVGEERDRRDRVDEHEVAQPGQLAARPSPRSTRSSRRAGCRRRARCGRRTSRRTAGRRCRRRRGRPRAAARGASPTPPSRSATGSPERSTLATCSTVSASTGGRRAAGRRRRRGVAPSLHDTSAGRISVATCPGGAVAAATASAVDAAEVLRALGPADPRRHVARHGVDVGRQRRVELGRGRWRGRRRC